MGRRHLRPGTELLQNIINIGINELETRFELYRDFELHVFEFRVILDSLRVAGNISQRTNVFPVYPSGHLHVGM